MAKQSKQFNEPETLDDVVWMLYIQTDEYRAKQNVQPDTIDEKLPHHGFGTGIRNSLHLWWSEDLAKHVFEKDPNADYPKTKPKLVQWFNDLNIYHADDMSGTIQAALKAKIAAEPFDVQKHIQRYFRHWKKYGYKDGICLPEFKVGPDPKVITFDDDDDDED
jgi:hypothetical protein